MINLLRLGDLDRDLDQDSDFDLDLDFDKDRDLYNIQDKTNRTKLRLTNVFSLTVKLTCTYSILFALGIKRRNVQMARNTFFVVETDSVI